VIAFRERRGYPTNLIVAIAKGAELSMTIVCSASILEDAAVLAARMCLPHWR
jgi:hypothetical protein